MLKMKGNMLTTKEGMLMAKTMGNEKLINDQGLWVQWKKKIKWWKTTKGVESDGGVLGC